DTSSVPDGSRVRKRGLASPDANTLIAKPDGRVTVGVWAYAGAASTSVNASDAAIAAIIPDSIVVRVSPRDLGSPCDNCTGGIAPEGGRRSMAQKARRREVEQPAPETSKPDWLVLGLSVAGLVVAGYLTWLKWAGHGALLCVAGSGCDLVQASRYS